EPVRHRAQIARMCPASRVAEIDRALKPIPRQSPPLRKPGSSETMACSENWPDRERETAPPVGSDRGQSPWPTDLSFSAGRCKTPEPFGNHVSALYILAQPQGSIAHEIDR